MVKSLTALTLLMVIGCSVDAPQNHARIDPAYDRYARSLNVEIDNMTRQPSGLYMQDVALGGGREATAGSMVDVDYVGYLPDGTKFDSSYDRGQPITFRLGAGQVIPGWEEGVQGMRGGGKRRVIIPTDLAYGARGAGNVIPPNANLVFDVELRGVR